MKNVVTGIGIVALALIGGGVWWYTNQTESEQTNTVQDDSAKQADEEKHEAEAASIITYSDTGFSASKDTVAAGSTVRVINQSSERLDFSSDPHPQHTDNAELNMPTLAPGEQATIVVDEPGRWGYHNHLNDDHVGFLTVTD